MEDSLRKRYFFKLFSSIIGFAISIVTQAMISRGLGPKSFGDYSFLVNTFTQVILFFDFGNTSGFYVKISQRPKELGLIVFYTYFTGVALFIFLILFSTLSFYPGFVDFFFPNQEVTYIMLALLFGILARYQQILNNITDAYGYTVKSEKALIAQKFIGLLIIGVLFSTTNLNIKNYLTFQYLTTLALVGFFVFLLRNIGLQSMSNWKISVSSAKQYMHEFYQYSHPLFIGFIFTTVALFLDRWLLQFFAGSVEQGFYGFAYQICAFSALFTSAMSMLIMREFSIAFKKNAYTEMAYLFRRFIPLLYSLTAYMSCFTAIQSDKIISIMGGESFNGAYVAVFIMCFYPIHQTYGQLSGAVMLATGETKKYAKLSIYSVFIGLPMLFILLIPSTSFGFQLGASGLAIKMVVIQIIFVNIQLYYNANLLSLNYKRYLIHQFGSVAILLAISIAVRQVIDLFLQFNIPLIPSFLINGFLYTIIVGILIYFKPIIFGISGEDVLYVKNLLSRMIKNR